MSTKIRLARVGRRNLPFYHVVVADSRSPRDGKFIEKVGYYDPVLASDAKNRLNLKLDRIEYWLSVGAEPTERVAIFLNKLGVKGAEKYKPVFTPKERQPKKDKKAKK
ncbi:MAG: 30S ribosomal protein S16 [Rickettsiales bacterium]|nr:30S ribosomal protein S16 [Rickettsiales bacterium]